MKICLINPKGVINSEFSIPHGLLQIAAELKKNGYSCNFLDCNDPDIKIDYGHLNKFDVVGFSVMTTQLKHATEIADNLNKNVKVVWGGAHCLLDPASIINKYRNHYVISGDGERPLLKLIDYFNERRDFDFIKNQEGISCYNNRLILNAPFFIKDLNELEDINYYNLPNLEKYIYRKFDFIKKPQKVNMLRILTSRGCSWNCSFCINSIYRKYKAFHRSKSLKKIRQETEKVIRDFNIKFVFPQDEDFFINKELVEEWKNYAKEMGFYWGADCRYNYFKSNMLNDDTLKNLVDAGLFFVGMSIEAGAEDLRNKILNKQLKDEEIYNAVEIIKRLANKRIVINTSFIINFPGDTKINKIKIMKWMYYLSNNLNIAFSGPQIYRSYPGSKLYFLQKDHKNGDLDYYLKNISGAGELKGSKLKQLESLFYSNLLIRYFNGKIRFFELKVDGGVSYLKLLEYKKLEFIKMLNSVFFLPIKLRLKFDYWNLFFEPFLMGIFFSPVQKIKRFLSSHNI